MDVMTETRLEQIDIQHIDLDPAQPRQEIDQAALEELAASIAEQGVVTPLRVVARPDGRYQLLYGERRLRAAMLNGMATVPCLVDATVPTWEAALDIQLTENLHRAELRPLEVAQTLWRRILGANIAAIEEERAEDGAATARLLASYLTPSAQIAALEDRLAALAGVGSVVDYFRGGQVRVSRKTILARYGMAGWEASRLRKLFGTLDVAPEVQDLLAGVDVSARVLRDLRQFAPEEQVAIVSAAREVEDGDVGGAVRKAIAEKSGKSPRASATLSDGDAGGDDGEDDGAPLPLAEPTDAFVPDPALALLTKGHTAPKLVVDQAPPARGSTPPVTPVGAWEEDAVLILEGALEAARQACADAGVLTLSAAQRRRVAPLWAQLVAAMAGALNE
ncbi:ParB/RepB/Spo0J family partition protein [Chloroflexia bacterium SDU3-3]|nr:ParB/RepB/Spo0J family partition protein [Chloroflexia bacterium SDU3-3]